MQHLPCIVDSYLAGQEINFLLLGNRKLPCRVHRIVSAAEYSATCFLKIHFDDLNPTLYILASQAVSSIEVSGQTK